MDKHCRICHNTSCSNHGKNISFLGEGWKCNYIPVPTNADRIRAMSDEELAEMLWKTGRNYRAVCADPVVDHDEQYAEIVKWLQQPAEDIGDGN